MEKTAKITKCTFKNEWTGGSNGSVFYHDLEMDNGDTGSIGVKAKEPEKIKSGTTITYTLETSEKGNKIKLVNSSQNQGFSKKGGYVQQDSRVNNISFAMSYSKDLAVAGKIEIEAIETTFEKIYSAMDKKYQQIKGEQPKPEEEKAVDNKPATSDKSTNEQYKRAEKILKEGTLFTEEERKKTLDKLKDSTAPVAEGMITKLIVQSNSRKAALVQKEEEDGLPF